MVSNIYNDIKNVMNDLGTTDRGLSGKEVLSRQKKYGKNILRKQNHVPYIVRYLIHFTDLLAIVLIAASGLSLLLGSPKDALIILLVVIANSTIGFFQEYKADKAIDALKKFVAQTATVIRESERVVIDASLIVPGDIIVLSEGMRVPADIRLISANELETNDASLTGESQSQQKTALTQEDKISVGDTRGTVFMGTDVVSGEGRGVVIATGMKTHFGKIAKATSAQKITKSPLQIEIDHIAKMVSKVTFWIVILLLVVYTVSIGHFDAMQSFRFSIGIASSLVPEGLPATVSIALAIGIQKMARRKATIRRLSAVETLGEANYIITDKTGTLTKNQMTVKEIYSNNERYHVKGVGYGLDGLITLNGIPCGKEKLDELQVLFNCITIANNAEVDTKNHHPPDYSGESTEIALLVAAEKAGIDTYNLQKESVTLQEVPFNSERKYRAKAVKIHNKEFVYINGALSSLLNKCTKILKNDKITNLSDFDKQAIETQNDTYSKDALRVMASAYKPMDSKAIDSDLIFLGLLGIIDPPREDVAETIRLAQKAGIKIVMATGDYGLTAAAIGKKIGLIDNPVIIDGSELSKISDAKLYDLLLSENVIFSRVDPIHKLRLVKILHGHGNIVAVTGDGVNDAPALKASNIGVAMGITGTDVTKEAAEMVSLNDSFSSIIWAIKEGRTVYENIKRVTRYVFTSNIAEFVAVLFGFVIGLPPISVIQILLVDLGAEVFPALGLAGDVEEDDVMSSQPRPRSDILFGKDAIMYIVRSGLLMGILAIVGFCIFGFINGWSFGSKLKGEAYIMATTVTYACLTLCQYVNAFSIRSMNKPIWRLLKSRRVWISVAFSFVFINTLIYVPVLQNFSDMAGISLLGWAIAIGIASVYLMLLELIKYYKYTRNKIHI